MSSTAPDCAASSTQRTMSARFISFGRKLYRVTGMCDSTRFASTSRVSSCTFLVHFVRSRAFFARYASAWLCVKIPFRAVSSSDPLSALAVSASAPTSCTNSWSLSMPIPFTTASSGTSSVNELCFSMNLPFRRYTTVRLFVSCVDDVTFAHRFPFESCSTMIRFLLICSCDSITFSTPRTTK